MIASVRVLGGGVAGLTCARLLARQGWEVEILRVIEHADQSPVEPRPALVLNEATLALLSDVWGTGSESSARCDLIEGAQRLAERRVRWEPGTPESTVPTASVAIDGSVLVQRLVERLVLDDRGNGCPRVRFVDVFAAESDAGIDEARSGGRTPAWLIDARGRGERLWFQDIAPQPPGARRRFGHRCVINAEVMHLAEGDAHVSRIEAVPGGWVHLTPLGQGRAVVQAMVPATPVQPACSLETLLGHTSVIGDRIGEVSGPISVFGGAPGATFPCCGPLFPGSFHRGRVVTGSLQGPPRWLCVGDAALVLDPLAGAGTGHAIRGAILAAAVIEAVASGLPQTPCLRHYAWRLSEALASHLQLCLRYYASTMLSPAWGDEMAMMEAGLRTVSPAATPPDPRYQLQLELRGFRLDLVYASSA